MDPQIKELLTDCAELFDELANRLVQFSFNAQYGTVILDEIKDTQNHIKIFSEKVRSL